MDALKIKAKVAGGGIGGHLGILLVWLLNQKLGAGLGETEIGAVIALCSFLASYLVRE